MVEQPWPFRPHNARTKEQQQAWWSECFVTTSAIRELLATSGSAVIYGGMGSGKSVALAALQQQATDTFFVRYPVQNWPSGQRPWHLGKSHFQQMMAAIANELVKYFTQNPATIPTLSTLVTEFVLWLIAHHTGRRRLALLLNSVRQATAVDIKLPETSEPLYDDDESTVTIRGQIAEVVDTIHALGYQRIALLTDLNEIQALHFAEDLKHLFRPDMLENKSFTLCAALPQSSLLRSNIKARSGSHLRLIPLYYTPAEIKEIGHRHLSIANLETCLPLTKLVNEQVLRKLEEKIIDIYKDPSPAGQLNLLDSVLAVTNSDKPILENEAPIIQKLYQRHIPLQLEPVHQAVWRGSELILLDKQPYDIVAALFQLGGPSPHSIERLIGIAGSATNVNTLISRIRKLIEPLNGRTPVYIHNRRDLGYWLENFVV